MAAMPLSEEDAKLASQCLEFCQTLADKSLTFSFSLTIGSSFSFSMDTRGKEVLASPRKRKSPSTLRRDARRREELLKKKLNAPTAVNSSQSEQASAKEAETDETELLLSPEKERSPQAPCELQMSPTNVQREEIKLSEEESASPARKAPAPSLTWATSPLGATSAPRVCGLSFSAWSRGPKCEKMLNESDWRCHAHEVHNLCMKVLKRDPAPCPYPGCHKIYL